MTTSLQYQRSAARFLAAKGLAGNRVSSRAGAALASHLAPLRLVNSTEPALPDGNWVRVAPTLAGICGSDLSLLTGQSSTYLGPLTSMPFVPGHEVVGTTLDELADLPRGSRVVLDPVLGCRARNLAPCGWCALGRTSRCDRVSTGRLAAGLQTGFCADTGGGWSKRFIAHASQLHPIPEGLPDDRAVLVEPLACAVHSVRRVEIPAGSSALVVGAGTVGLLTLLALRSLTQVGSVHVVAKHRHQKQQALALGATEVIEPGSVTRSLRRATSALLHKPEFGPSYLLGGVDFAFECTGGSSGLATGLRSVRAGGTVLLSGMPAGGVDLTPLWYRELHLVGAYASGNGPSPAPASTVAGSDRNDGERSDFDEAIELARCAPLDGYVEAYSLHDWREAIDHAASTGRLGSVKIAFDPTRQ